MALCRYRERVSYVQTYEEIVKAKKATFVNDHIAFRSIALQARSSSSTASIELQSDMLVGTETEHRHPLGVAALRSAWLPGRRKLYRACPKASIALL
eukprot:545903-Rhodomonas_salina.2